jgi:hypothetical protein
MTKLQFLSQAMLAIGIFLHFPVKAAEQCKWVPVVGQTVDFVQAEVKKRSGKEPTKSCGGGEDFKVCHSCEEKLTPEQWKKVKPLLAQQNYRNWHTTWHAEAVQFSMKPEQAKKMIPNVYRGESFFYLHRQFYRSVQANLAAQGLPCISPWTELPEQISDPEWPTYGYQQLGKDAKACEIDPVLSEKVKAANQDLQEWTSTKQMETQGKIANLMEAPDRMKAFKEIQELQRELRAETRRKQTQVMVDHKIEQSELAALQACLQSSPLTAEMTKHAMLRQSTELAKLPQSMMRPLGQIGHEIEATWHGALHESYETKQGAFCTVMMFAFDCDSMVAPISSHINMNFYKVHGFVDTYVDRWLKQNGYDRASENCGDDKKCYQWKGTFLGTVPDEVNGRSCGVENKDMFAPKPVQDLGTQ